VFEKPVQKKQNNQFAIPFNDVNGHFIFYLSNTLTNVSSAQLFIE